MKDELEGILENIESRSFDSADAVDSSELSTQRKMKDLMSQFRDVAPEHKRELEPLLNKVKTAVEDKVATEKTAFDRKEVVQSSGVDASRPAGGFPHGTHHPLQVVRREILGIFSNMGFSVVEGPEIEDDWHVFSGLNFPPEHPARDMQDTFFVERNPDLLLRTH